MIDPAEFTRLMTLPAHDRHDLLEFLGSTLAGKIGAAEVLRRVVVSPQRPGAAASRPDQH
ncbi:MAG: hypothetical protein ACK4TB_08515 [Gemmobacter sp.]